MADQKWKATNPSRCFDGSYLDQLPSMWANQNLGIATTTHLSNHINNSLTKLTFCGNSKSQSEVNDDFDHDHDDCWRFYHGLMEDRYFWHEDDFNRLLSTDTTTFDGGSVHYGCRGVT
jgi:hypothetical protein